MAGLVSAWYIYMKDQSIAERAYNKFRWLHTLLDKKYYADDINQAIFAGGALGLGKGLFKAGDRFVIDTLVVNGSAKVVGWFSGIIRHIQTGYLYHYAFAMIIGVLFIVSWLIFGVKHV
jgi:NADH-quinone oxidoreductase subunit L